MLKSKNTLALLTKFAAATLLFGLASSANAEQTPDNLGWDSNKQVIDTSKEAARFFYSAGSIQARERVQNCYAQLPQEFNQAYEKCMAMDVATLLAEASEVRVGRMQPDPYFTINAYRARNVPAFVKWGDDGNNVFRAKYHERFTGMVQVGLAMYVSNE